MRKLILVIIVALLETNSLVAQTFHGPPPYGNYFSFKDSCVNELIIKAGADTSHLEIELDERNIVCLILNDSVFVNQDSTGVFHYYPLQIHYDDMVFYRKSGFDSDSKRIMKSRYGNSQNDKFAGLHYLKFINGKHKIKTHYKNGELHGVSSDRVGCKYYYWYRIKNGKKKGIFYYNLPYLKSYGWRSKWKTKEVYGKRIHPKNSAMEKYFKSYNW